MSVKSSDRQSEIKRAENRTTTTMKTSFCAAAFGLLVAGLASPAVKASAITVQVGGGCREMCIVAVERVGHE